MSDLAHPAVHRAVTQAVNVLSMPADPLLDIGFDRLDVPC